MLQHGKNLFPFGTHVIFRYYIQYRTRASHSKFLRSRVGAKECDGLWQGEGRAGQGIGAYRHRNIRGNCDNIRAAAQTHINSYAETKAVYKHKCILQIVFSIVTSYNPMRTRMYTRYSMQMQRFYSSLSEHGKTSLPRSITLGGSQGLMG